MHTESLYSSKIVPVMKVKAKTVPCDTATSTLDNIDQFLQSRESEGFNAIYKLHNTVQNPFLVPGSFVSWEL